MSAWVLAESTSSGSGGGLLGFLPLVLIGGVFLLLVTRGNRKRQAQAAAVQAAIEPGAEVVTTSGMYGTVRAIDDDDVSLEIAPGVVVLFARAAIARVVPEEAEEEAGPEADERAGPDQAGRHGPAPEGGAKRLDPGDPAA